MNEIQGIARLKIHDGKLEHFKRVASQCMQSRRSRGLPCDSLVLIWLCDPSDAEGVPG
jgi:hypothetical protein